MGMWMHAESQVEPNDEYNRMKRVYDVCTEMNVELPEEVYNYFDGKEPEGKAWITLPSAIASVENGQCIEINVADIPKGAEKIRIIYS